MTGQGKYLWVILRSAKDKKKTILDMFYVPHFLKSGYSRSDIRITPLSRKVDPTFHGSGIQIQEYCEFFDMESIEEAYDEGRIEEPYDQDFKHLQNEVSQITEKLAMLSNDVQEVLSSSLLPVISDREILYDLMNKLELEQFGHMDGPGGAILDQLRQDCIPAWFNLRTLLLYLLQALMVLSDTQLKLLAQSMEKRLLLHQLELVKRILQPNFKYPWNIPFTLQPQLLAPLGGEGLVITYELLMECGLKMELNNPRSTWDLEAKMPLSALYGSLSFLLQLVED